MAGWVIPTLGYVLLLGITGITTRYALRTITWEQIVLWVPIAYLTFSILLATTRGARFPLGIGGFWAAMTAFSAAGALVLFFFALTKGEASTVVPVSSAYPLVTLAGAAIFLGEQLTVARVIGALLIVSGVIVISH
jgi:transporter family protein